MFSGFNYFVDSIDTLTDVNIVSVTSDPREEDDDLECSFKCEG